MIDVFVIDDGTEKVLIAPHRRNDDAGVRDTQSFIYQLGSKPESAVFLVEW